MTGIPSDQALGAYLRSLRVNAGLDLSVLARSVSLSPEQLMELETAQGSLFYNARIRRLAARKVIMHLGGDLAQLGAPSSDPAVQSEVKAEALAHLDSVVAAAKKRKKSSISLVAWLKRPLAGGVALAMALGVGWFLLPPWQGGFTLPGVDQLMSLTRRAAVADGLVAAASDPAVRPASTQAPQLPEAASSQEPAPPATEDGDKAASPEQQACAWMAQGLPIVQPPQARKPGDMVYVVSRVSQVVCAIDAKGQVQTRQLAAGQGHSFYGQPPWQLNASHLQEADVFFQGWKVRLPAEVEERVQLVELR